MSRLATIGLYFALVTAVAVPAGAATIKTYNRDSFSTEMLTKNEKVETFDKYTLGPLAKTDGVSYSVTGGNVVVTDVYLSSTGFNSLGSSPGAFFNFAQSVTFTFTMSITAFAIDINTFATTNGAFVAKLDTGESVASVFNPFLKINPANGPESVPTGQFIGFTSSAPFNSVTVSGTASNGQEPFNLDTLVTVAYVKPEEPKPEEPEPEVPAVVPLPASLPLFLASLGFLGLVRRRSVV